MSNFIFEPKVMGLLFVGLKPWIAVCYCHACMIKSGTSRKQLLHMWKILE